MSIITVTAGVLLGNGLTAAFIYAMWRIRRDENDLRAIGLALLLLAIGLAIALTGRSMSEAERRTGSYSSAAQHHAQR